MADGAIDQLSIDVRTQTADAIKGIDALEQSLKKLKASLKGGISLTPISKGLNDVSQATKGIDTQGVSNLERMAQALQGLTALQGLKISSSIGKQLGEITQATRAMAGLNVAPIADLSEALKTMSGIEKGDVGGLINSLRKVPEMAQALSATDMGDLTDRLRDFSSAIEPLTAMEKPKGLTSTITAIRKIPKVLKELKDMDMDDLKETVQDIADALGPLADEMERIADGFSRLPQHLRQLENVSRSVSSESSGKKSFNWKEALKVTAIVTAMKEASEAIAGWIQESNSYIEDINLFTVSMGQYADEARRYADEVSAAMGIDPGEWMRNQGVLQTLATGFGVAADRAYIMSKNLTQLGYDLSSFFNIATEESFQKLQSGLAGELEPLNLAA